MIYNIKNYYTTGLPDFNGKLVIVLSQSEYPTIDIVAGDKVKTIASAFGTENNKSHTVLAVVSKDGFWTIYTDTTKQTPSIKNTGTIEVKKVMSATDITNIGSSSATSATA
ncbi:MAG: hypothetical protein WC389_12390, partial [Lutibacter sp.]